MTKRLYDMADVRTELAYFTRHVIDFVIENQESDGYVDAGVVETLLSENVNEVVELICDYAERERDSGYEDGERDGYDYGYEEGCGDGKYAAESIFEDIDADLRRTLPLAIDALVGEPLPKHVNRAALIDDLSGLADDTNDALKRLYN